MPYLEKEKERERINNESYSRNKFYSSTKCTTSLKTVQFVDTCFTKMIFITTRLELDQSCGLVITNCLPLPFTEAMVDKKVK